MIYNIRRVYARERNDYNMKNGILSALVVAALVVTSACSAGKNSVVQVGDAYVSQSEFEYYLNSVKSQMSGTELSSEDDWQSKEIEGRKAIDLAKEKSLDTAVDNLAYIEVGKKVVELSDDDKENIKKLKERIVTANGGETTYKKYVEQMGLTDDFIDMLCESEMYKSKLTEKVSEENEITDEMMNKTFKEKYRRAKHILILTQDMTTGLDLSEEQQAQALAKAQQVFRRVQSGEDFDVLAAEFNEDPGVASNPNGYVFTDGEMVSEFQEGVDSLENGNVALVKTSYGYHIIKRMALDETPQLYSEFFESKKDAVKSAILADLLETQMEKWKSEYKVYVTKNEELYNSIG